MKSRYIECEFLQQQFLTCCKNNQENCGNIRDKMVHDDCAKYGFVPFHQKWCMLWKLFH